MNLQYWNDAIRIELGKNVIARFTSPKKMFAPAPQPCDIMISSIIDTRKNLEEKDIFLPPVSYGFNPELDGSAFRITCGLHDRVYYDYNVIDALIAEVISCQINETPSAHAVKNLVESGNNMLLKGKNNDAMNSYHKAYYWSLIIDEDVHEDFIMTLFNTGYIHYINGRLQEAYDCTTILSQIVEADNFHDPITRYHIHMFRANLLWINEQIDDAANMFQQCISDIKYADEPALMMLALYNLVSACFAMGIQNNNVNNICMTSLRSMNELTKSRPDMFSDGQRVTILDMITTVQDNIIAQLQQENINLRSRCDELERKLSPRVALGNTVRSLCGVLMTISALLPRQMSFVKTVGKLVVSGNTFNDDARVIDNLYTL